MVWIDTILVPSLWLKGFKIRLWVEGCLVFTVRVEEFRAQALG